MVAGTAALVGCTHPAPSERDLTAALQDSGLPKPVAACTSKALVGTLSDAELEEIANRGSGGAPVDDTDRTDDTADKLNQAMTKCQQLLTEALATSSTTSTTTPGGGPTTTVAVDPSGAVIDRAPN